MNLVENTPKESIIFDDSKVIVALAYESITQGHCVVIWKEEEEDINKLNTEDYEYLMDVVDVTRDILRKFYKVEKVYLMYLDETRWVHWHLIPRYGERGFDVLKHKPEKVADFQDIKDLSEIFKEFHLKMIIEN